MSEGAMAAGRLDGNAAGGILADVFVAQITAAVATCGGCGQSGPIGAAAVYALEMGLVLRCPGCNGALLRLVAAGGRVRLDLRGVSLLELPA